MDKVVFLDRDGVINKNRANYVKSWDEFEFLPNAKKGIKLLNDNGFKILIITNQSVVGRGIIKEKTLNEIHEKMLKELNKCRCRIEKIYCCPHAPWDNCDCRKPKPGMLLKAADDFDLDLKECHFIGDSKTDEEAGKIVGCKTYLVSENRDLLDIVRTLIK
ncbi:MAG: HAD family hydrolase [Euryarchaeota archaeon CG_4_9_14_3_um_filter_38_12]|nr:MAG: HAD family hydrolase [Euryarchaeota archaeon CG_4_9_14_3_um_filter_38_12]